MAITYLNCSTVSYKIIRQAPRRLQYDWAALRGLAARF